MMVSLGYIVVDFYLLQSLTWDYRKDTYDSYRQKKRILDFNVNGSPFKNAQSL